MAILWQYLRNPIIFDNTDAALRHVTVGGCDKKSTDELQRENEALRERLTRLSEASLRINETLDFDTVLQEVLDSARTLPERATAASLPLASRGGWRKC